MEVVFSLEGGEIWAEMRELKPERDRFQGYEKSLMNQSMRVPWHFWLPESCTSQKEIKMVLWF